MNLFNLKVLVLVFLSTSSSISSSASISFDLDSQNFANAISSDDMLSGRYSLAEAYVSTNLNYISGYYTTSNDHGYFNVEIKEPPENWSVALSARYVLSNHDATYHQTRSIVFTGANGESFSISFKYNEVILDGENVYQPSSFQRLSISIVKNGTNVELFINGSKVGTANKSNFPDLKFVSIQLIEEKTSSGAGSNYHSDILHSLIIGSE